MKFGDPEAPLYRTVRALPGPDGPASTCGVIHTDRSFSLAKQPGRPLP